MKRALLMGIDIGTTGCKTILVDESGKVVASEIDSYPLYSSRHGWSEQNPEDWWIAVKNTIKRTMGRNKQYTSNLMGIGLSGQMHGLVALDKDRSIIRPSILWNDQRTEKQCIEVYEKVDGVKGLLRYTNNRMLPGYTGGKILWVRENEPECYERINSFVNPKDYIRYCLTGELATEVSDASGTGLFNVKSRSWSRELFSILDIPYEWAPSCYESIEISGTVLGPISTELGLPKNLPVVGGGGDSVIQTLGTGVITSDILMTTIGTAGIISTALEGYRDNPDGKLQIFCNVMPGEWHAMGVTLSAGGSMSWAKDVIGFSETEVARISNEDVYDIISREAEQSVPGSNGIIFLPYLTGERCPHSDPAARGAFIGLSLSTEKSDLFRSIMEGVIFSFRDVADIFSSIGQRFTHIETSGGGAQSSLWRQIHADIFKKDVFTVSGSREGAAYGAAIVAGVGMNVWPDFKEASNLLTIETETGPNEKNYHLYDNYFRIYKSYYDILRSSFEQLSSA